MKFSQVSAVFLLLAATAAFGVVEEVTTSSAADWTCWPGGKVQVSVETVEGGAKALRFEQLENTGFFSHSIKRNDGAILKEFRFRIKALPGNRENSLEVLLQDNDDELFFRNINLTPDWVEHRFDASSLALYTYGGAKIADGKLDVANVKNLRFNGWPAGRDFLVSNIEFFYLEAIADGLLAEALPANASNWNAWPAGEVEVTVQDDVLTFDFRKTGHLSMALPKFPGYNLNSISFEARLVEGSEQSSQEVMLTESSGEIYYTVIELDEERRRHTLPLSGFRIFTYGGAKILDGKLDSNEITSLRFNGSGKPRMFEISNLELQWKKEEEPDVGNFTIRPIPWGERTEDFHADYPDAQTVSINGNAFIRNGKRTFLLGGWQLDVDGPPWLMQMFCVDVMVYNADEIYTLYAPTRKPDGSLEISWRENPWYEAIIRRFLNSGILFWHEHKAHPQYSAIRDFPEFAEVYKAGHFVPYDPFHPKGEAMYLEMFKSWMRYTRKYPVFCYELFNEMAYDNPHLISRKAFREAMAEKFGDIAAANQAWGSAFQSFDEVNPPGYISDNGENKELPRETLIAQEGKRFPNLMIDWEKFQQERCHEAVESLMSKMRELDPDPNVFSTLQSHLNLWLDSARIGIKPETLVDFSDFYSHEVGITYPESGDYRNFNYLSQILKPLFCCDAARGFCPEKPIFNAESPLNVSARGADQIELENSDLAGLHSPWKFHDATSAVPEQWNTRDFSDSAWGTVTVPAMWGNEGHPTCQVGIYRKHFRLEAPENGRIYLNGTGFADEAEIWLNDVKIGEVNGFDARFSFDVTDLVDTENVIAAKIENHYFLDGTYCGGIRGFVSVNTMPFIPNFEANLEERHVRSFFWSQAVRGISGVMLCYESNLMRPSSKYLPGVRAELNNLAEIVFDPAARRPARIAMVHPLEIQRSVTHKDYLERINSPATSELMPFYAGALFSRAGVDVVRNSDLADSRPLKWQLVLLPSGLRTKPEVLDCLKQFVAEGGNLLLDFGALSIDDETHAPLDASTLTGVRMSGTVNTPGEFSLPGIGAGKNRLRFLDGATRGTLELAGAEELFRYADEMPLLTEFRLGQGRVFYLNGSFDGDVARKLTGWVIDRIGIRPAVELAAFRENPIPDAVESHLFTDEEGRQVLMLQNLDLDGAAIASLPEIPEGRYHMRNAATGKTIPAPATELWSAAELREGMPVRLLRYDPVVLLIEPEKCAQLTLNGISPLRLKMLEELWRDVPPVAGQPSVAITPITSSQDLFGVAPTARRVLTDHGFNLKNFTRDASLENIDILIWQQQRFKEANPERIAEFVRNGGSLVLCGNAQLNYHVMGANRPLLELLGIAEGGMHTGAVYAVPVPPPPGDNLQVECRDFTEHPITEHVRSFVTAGSNYLEKLPENAEVLLRTPANSSAPEKPILAIFPFGEGQVVWIGDYWFLRPLNFELADNAQLWLNIMNFLAKKPIRALTAAELEESLYVTGEKLRQAERDERAGNTIIAVPCQTPTYLDGFNSAEISGVAGDPIVDLMTL